MRRGLTLAELLVALAVTTIIAAGVASMLGGAVPARVRCRRPRMLATAAIVDHDLRRGRPLHVDEDETALCGPRFQVGRYGRGEEAAWMGFRPRELSRTILIPEDRGPEIARRIGPRRRPPRDATLCRDDQQRSWRWIDAGAATAGATIPVRWICNRSPTGSDDDHVVVFSTTRRRASMTIDYIDRKPGGEVSPCCWCWWRS